MSAVDWLLFVGFLTYVVWDGVRKHRSAHSTADYFLAGRAVPWWAMGLSIMATQASAITMVGTTGQGWADGLRFIQFYLALPLAMLILAFTAVPLYHRLQISTAYEFLGLRFDRKTRLLGAGLFLVLRSLSVGFVIFAPALVLARVFHLPLAITVVAMGSIAVVYTAIGGLGAVIRTDVKQMAMMTLGLLIALVMVIVRLPDEVGLSGAWTLADAAGRLQWVDLRWDPSEKYTLWSSLGGGLFLFLSYFGTDQSQVQRLLAGRSLVDKQRALLLNAVAKLPFQLLVLTIGVLLFVFYTFHGTPLSFEPASALGSPIQSRSADTDTDDIADDQTAYAATSERYQAAEAELRAAATDLLVADRTAGEIDSDLTAATARYRQGIATTQGLRAEARALRGGNDDSNYVFLDFILTQLPIGVVGLLLAAIFAAALSSIDSEINSMATVAVLDLYPVIHPEPLAGDKMVRVSRIATVIIGAFATTFALYAGQIGSLIEGVNRVGSYIYGSLLGVFILAAAVRRANGNGAFYGMLVGVVAVWWAASHQVAFLYLNTIGAVTVLIAGTAISWLTTRSKASKP